MAATTGPRVSARHCWRRGTARCGSSGCSRCWRAQSWPSRASSVKLGQDQRSASTPQSFFSRSAAAMASRKMVPEPSSCTRGPLDAAALPEQVHALEDVGFGTPAGISGMLVVLVHHRQVIEHVLLLGDHAPQAVLHDHRHFVGEGRIVGDAVRDRRRAARASGRPRAAGLRRSAWCGRRCRRPGSRARAESPAAQPRSMVRCRPNIE